MLAQGLMFADLSRTEVDCMVEYHYTVGRLSADYLLSEFYKKRILVVTQWFLSIMLCHSNLLALSSARHLTGKYVVGFVVDCC